jgi:hypothetical protein
LNKEKKLKELNQKIEELRHKITNSYKAGLRFNTTQKEKVDKEKDFDKWLKYDNKIKFYSELLTKAEHDLSVLESEKNIIIGEIQRKEYLLNLKDAYSKVLPLLESYIEEVEKLYNGDPYNQRIGEIVLEGYTKAFAKVKSTDNIVRDLIFSLPKWMDTLVYRLAQMHTKDKTIHGSFKGTYIESTYKIATTYTRNKITLSREKISEINSQLKAYKKFKLF